MSKSNLTEIEQGIGSEVDHFVYRVPKKNHDAMVQLNKQFAEIMRKYGAPHLIFQLNNTEAPMDGITNITKTVSANQDDEVWMELIFYRDRKHRDEVSANMQNDESMGRLFQQSLDLVTAGTGFIMGEFSRIRV
ncbi:MAG TPA: DUF1428 family protein [Nitrososphaeraceae archaeon]|jgi:uncharacterized protein YbaA (DUF1428 family)|nr:DUF1428 family protein [Nitrososphaeraceae archaeon]